MITSYTMSTLTGEQESRLLESEEELYSYFQAFAKPVRDRRVGMECELFGIERETGKALPYRGPRGIEAVLCRLAAVFHYEPILEEGHVIALKRGETWITLEPGGQMELSTPPVQTVFEIEKELQSFADELQEIKNYFPGITWLSVGIHPFSSLTETPWVPKQRYAVMADYFKSRGPLAPQMMKLTATNQASFDFPDEATALSQLRTVFAVTSILSALFANSSFSDGRPNGFLARRVEIWNATDPERCGLLPSFLREGQGFRDYVEYLLKMPMIFIVRDHRWVPMKGISFRQFLRNGKGNHRATQADFELHLSTAFPEARFKKYLEIRGIDAQRRPLIPSVAAFWKGILYDDASREKSWDLVRHFSLEDRARLHQEVPRLGLKARLGSVCIKDFAQELFRLSREGLKNQAPAEARSEAVYLDRVEEEILKPGRTPAETLLEKWHGEFAQKPENLIRYLEIA